MTECQQVRDDAHGLPAALYMEKEAHDVMRSSSDADSIWLICFFFGIILRPFPDLAPTRMHFFWTRLMHFLWNRHRDCWSQCRAYQGPQWVCHHRQSHRNRKHQFLWRASSDRVQNEPEMPNISWFHKKFWKTRAIDNRTAIANTSFCGEMALILARS